jgi:hypothetical protein
MFPEHFIPYDTSKYDFQGVLQRIFNVENLQYVHTLQPSLHEQVTFHEDTKTWFHKHYYSSPIYGELLNVYDSFVRDIILPRYTDSAYAVQVDPSFRIGIPNNTALGIRDNERTERIGFHCDADYNHQPGEINFIVPLTPMFDTNSVFVESEPGKEDYHSINTSIGNAFCFYGNKCKHYNVKNETGVSRLSIDFRIIPMSQYDHNWNAESVHGKRPLTLGGYFKRINGNTGGE